MATVALLTQGNDTVAAHVSTVTGSVSPTNGTHGARVYAVVAIRSEDLASVAAETIRVSGCGLAWTIITNTEQVFDVSNRMKACVIRGIGTPAAGALTIDTVSGRPLGRTQYVIVEGLGTSANELRQVAAVLTNTNTTPAQILAAFGHANNAALFAIMLNGNNATFTPEGGYTQLDPGGVTNRYAAYRVGQDLDPSATLDVMRTWVAWAFEIEDAAAGGGGGTAPTVSIDQGASGTADLSDGTLQLTASTTGSPAPSLAWSSDDEGIATVDSSGLVTFVTPGVVNITVVASNGNLPNASDSFELIINDDTPPPDNIEWQVEILPAGEVVWQLLEDWSAADQVTPVPDWNAYPSGATSVRVRSRDAAIPTDISDYDVVNFNIIDPPVPGDGGLPNVVDVVQLTSVLG